MKLFLKGVLFYGTILITMLVLMGIDSLHENGYLSLAIFIAIFLIVICTSFLSNDDYDKLS